MKGQAVWRAALFGRLSYLMHRTCGHTVTWRTSPPDLPLCAGDIVCHDCRQVLWCRGHDPWRVLRGGGRGAPADHWGGTSMPPRGDLFQGLDHVLRLAQECPLGASGDDIRRSACELIEASSALERDVRVRHLLKTIGRVDSRRVRGRSREDDPSPTATRQLIDAVRGEVMPALGRDTAWR